MPKASCPHDLTSSPTLNVAALLLTTAVVSGAAAQSQHITVEVAADDGSAEILVGDALFTRAHLRTDAHVPFLYPVLGPGGIALTRNWPMAEGEHEEQDHPHHRSLWFAHGAVRGHDFWTGRDGSRIQHSEVLAAVSGERGVLKTRNRWRAPDGTIVAVDERSWVFAATSETRSIDVDLVLRAEVEGLVLGDTKEGTMAIRVAPPLRQSGEVAVGTILNSAGQRDGAVWGQRARWVDYSGIVEGQALGIAIFDHPDNPRHPTWWHARTYGLLAANPFGAHDFEKAAPGTGDMELGKGETLRLRYRLLFHRGAGTAAMLEAEFARFTELATD